MSCRWESSYLVPVAGAGRAKYLELVGAAALRSRFASILPVLRIWIA